MESQFESILTKRKISLDVINMQDYGVMDGEKVLNKALALIKG
ncbi:hypothetical protein [Clostridium sardiniense]